MILESATIEAPDTQVSSLVIRAAETQQDIAAMLNGTITVIKHSWFSQLPFAFTSAEDIAKWYLGKTITDTGFCLYVAEENKEIVGGCGGYLANQLLPPHLRYVSEWTWWGTKQAATKTWRAVEQWGKARGAHLSCYVTQAPNSEHLHWRAI